MKIKSFLAKPFAGYIYKQIKKEWKLLWRTSNHFQSLNKDGY